MSKGANALSEPGGMAGGVNPNLASDSMIGPEMMSSLRTAVGAAIPAFYLTGDIGTTLMYFGAMTVGTYAMLMLEQTRTFIVDLALSGGKVPVMLVGAALGTTLAKVFVTAEWIPALFLGGTSGAIWADANNIIAGGVSTASLLLLGY